MKKTFLALLGAGIVLAIANIALASNYTYKVYNSNLNKTYTANLGTISLTDTEYLWAFYTKEGQPLCIVNLNTNTDKNGLVGGQCTDIDAFISFMSGESIDMNSPKYTLGYREFNPNTFYKEMNELQQERAAQGKFVFNVGNTQEEKTNFTPRYKAGQSDKEICVRNYGGTWACMDSPEYSKTVADIMKNGGCIVSVPDMGRMYKDLKYCQSTKNPIHVMYLPSGETKLINPVDEYNVAAKPPMSDKEYKEEIEEYKRSK